ncbi:histidine kinase [Winogradskyella sp. A3E31]|uniref:tetratricopeptide repeat-containing sensor histidine kinase n=1 Tax=Winogradskyella sp. A3E31 TaxID=3349637 RepID=UPI00398B0322
MKFRTRHLIFAFAFFVICPIYGQAGLQDNEENKLFTVRGSVREKYSYEPISKVNIEVTGGDYSVTSYDGNFKIKVKIGDELVVRHKDFQTVYYTIKNDDRIIIEVEPEEPEPTRKEILQQKSQSFNQLMDSAQTYLKLDAERSIKFIADALDNSISQNQSAEAYEVLGDIYTHWKQNDLAISNYRISLQNIKATSTQLKLAKAYTDNKNYQESIETYLEIKKANLSELQKVELYEGLGDAYEKSKDYDKALTAYNKGLSISEAQHFKSKETDLNSKIAKTYTETGNVDRAKDFYGNSLRLASEVNQKRAVEEKVTVAEFNNVSRNYNDEIELRKQVVDALPELEKDSVIANESNITPQKQNYKIGTAYYLKGENDKAIPFLEKSIEEADNRSDLIVKKDGLKKLTDVYKSSGDYDNARLKFEEYIKVVDELYIKKEQELAQAARFAKNLVENQNRITSLENERQLSKSRFELAEQKNRNQQIIIYSLIGGIILISIAGFFTYKYIKQQRLANNLLALKSLRSQMNPHFIFNALNSVNSFIAINDERTANKYLSDFSFLMRAVLENSEEDFIPLHREIELIELYTKLEHFRFKDKFEYTITVDDKVDIDAFMIPPMLLQPYIENAVWHGLRYKDSKGHLGIRFKYKNEDEIEIHISDDGIGRTKSKALKTENQKQHQSKGLTNIKKRVAILNRMYKDKVDVSISDFQDVGDVGTLVIVTLKKD